MTLVMMTAPETFSWLLLFINIIAISPVLPLSLAACRSYEYEIIAGAYAIISARAASGIH